jgi:hypothetical protein
VIAVRTLYRRVQQQQQEGMPRETRVLSVVFVSCDTTATKKNVTSGFRKILLFYSFTFTGIAIFRSSKSKACAAKDSLEGIAWSLSLPYELECLQTCFLLTSVQIEQVALCSSKRQQTFGQLSFSNIWG